MQDPFKESERVFCWVYLSMNYCLRRKETWRLGGMGEWEKQQELHNGERKTCSGIIIAAHHHDGVMRSGAPPLCQPWVVATADDRGQTESLLWGMLRDESGGKEDCHRVRLLPFSTAGDNLDLGFQFLNIIKSLSFYI